MMIRKESVAVINETVSPHPLPDAVLTLVASNVTSHLRQLLLTANKFSRHSFRSTILPDDLASALRIHRQPSIHSYKSQSLRGGSGRWKSAGNGLHYAHDEVIDFTAALAKPLPATPVDVGLGIHWLAIEGVSTRETIPTETPVVAPLPNPPPVRTGGLNLHLVSKEQQLFFNKTTAAICSDDPVLVQASLQTIVTCSGLQPLAPFYIHYVSSQITHNLRSLPLLHSTLQLMSALLTSPHLNIEPYLHQLLPSLLTLIVGNPLCVSPNEQDHWSLRHQSSILLSYVLHRFSPLYTSLHPRITKTLTNALLDTSRPLTTHYGAIVGLRQLGKHVVKNCILPHLAKYFIPLNNLRRGGNPIQKMEAGRVYGALLAAVGDSLHAEPQPIGHKKQKIEMSSISSYPDLSSIIALFGDDWTTYMRKLTAK